MSDSNTTSDPSTTSVPTDPAAPDPAAADDAAEATDGLQEIEDALEAAGHSIDDLGQMVGTDEILDDLVPDATAAPETTDTTDATDPATDPAIGPDTGPDAGAGTGADTGDGTGADSDAGPPLSDEDFADVSAILDDVESANDGVAVPETGTPETDAPETDAPETGDPVDAAADDASAETAEAAEPEDWQLQALADVTALLAGMTDDDGNKAFDAVGDAESDASAGGAMDQDDIERMLAEAGAAESSGESSAEPSGGAMDQDDIERMLAEAGAAESSAEPSGGAMDQDDIERMLAEAGAAEPSRGTEIDLPADASINDVDAALAENVEGILHGTFEDVSDVLGDVFDERSEEVLEAADAEGLPSLDDDGLTPPVEPELNEVPRNIGGTEAAAAAPDDSDDELDAAFDDAAFGSVDDVMADTDVAFDDAGEFVAPDPADETADEPTAQSADAADAAGDDTTDVQAVGDEDDAADPTSDSVGALPKVEFLDDPPEDDAVPAGVGAAESPDGGDAAEPTSKRRGGVQVMAMARRAEVPAVMALSLMNYPLRFVPASFRPMVDWLALTLLLWVPIVWILSLLFGG